MAEINGTNSDDTIRGTAEADDIDGRKGDDTIKGRGGDDFLRGGSDDDTLRGGSGSDTLNGEAGFDTLNGGPGADLFIFRDGHNDDIIVDFEAGKFNDEVIDLSDFGFASLRALRNATSNDGDGNVRIDLDSDQF